MQTIATITDPIIGRWYKDVENNVTFKVVATEDNDDMIEVQYMDGDIGEYDRDSWYNATFDYIEPPEDWSAAYGDVEKDDLGYSDPDRRDPDTIDINDWLDK